MDTAAETPHSSLGQHVPEKRAGLSVSFLIFILILSGEFICCWRELWGREPGARVSQEIVACVLPGQLSAQGHHGTDGCRRGEL